MEKTVPLSSLLSFALVAYTIEFDNEVGHRFAHRTTRGRRVKDAPWLVSLAMWANCMRLVDDDGIGVKELHRRAGAMTNLKGMVRWGYLTVDGDRVIRPTAAGKRAKAVWNDVSQAIEQRWDSRFGEHATEQLRQSLCAVIEHIEFELPAALPILHYGLWCPMPKALRRPRGAQEAMPLSALLAKVLVAFALHYERDSEISLAIAANVLRLFSEDVMRVRDLPRAAGVSKEAIAMALGFLVNRGYVTIEQGSAGTRVKCARLLPAGRRARDQCVQRLASIESIWRQRMGNSTIDRVRKSLEPIVGSGDASQQLLFDGIRPYPEGWRAAVAPPQTLPHFPMVLHRGGFPDGA